MRDCHETWSKNSEVKVFRIFFFSSSKITYYFGLPDPYFLAEWIFSESSGASWFTVAGLWLCSPGSQAGLCSEPSSSGGPERPWCAASLEAAVEQTAGVFQTAVLPVRFLAFSGCGRGLSSCQVCWLDSEENLFSPHITNDDPRGVGAVGGWPPPPKPIYKNKTRPCSVGLNRMAKRRGVHAKERFLLQYAQLIWILITPFWRSFWV